MIVLAATLALLAQAPQSGPGGEKGKVSGKVTIGGLAPKLANLPVTRDIKTCGANKPDESLVVGQAGGVKNAVVWVVDGPKPPRGFKQKYRLDQKNCEFTPHMVAMPEGGVLEVVNSDKLFHNVHARSAPDKSVFNYAMPVPDYTIPKPLKTPERLRVSCDVHPWMRAWVNVLPTTAFAVTDESGTYTIEGVPPGRHKIHLWHERLGEKEEEVEVVAGQTATFDVPLSPR
jgi:plastocyanin